MTPQHKRVGLVPHGHVYKKSIQKDANCIMFEIKTCDSIEESLRSFDETQDKIKELKYGKKKAL